MQGALKEETSVSAATPITVLAVSTKRSPYELPLPGGTGAEEGLLTTKAKKL